MWWYESYGIPAALTYGDTSGLFYWFFIYGFLFEKQVKLRSLIQPWEFKKMLKHCQNVQTKDTLHVFPPGFFKSVFWACTFIRKGNWGMRWNNMTMPCSRGRNWTQVSCLSPPHELQEPPCLGFTRETLKALIERLHFPWSRIKWNKLDTQVGLLV